MPSPLSLLLNVAPADMAPGRLQAERREPDPSPLDDAALALQQRLLLPLWRGVEKLAGRDGLRHRQAQRLLAAVQAVEPALAGLDDGGLRARWQSLRLPLRRQGFALPPVAEAFALVREAASRVLGCRHHPTQLAAGWWLLQGTLVEMATGEGKTIAATLPAATAALAGLPVHVVTANDYLAHRDAQTLAPLYQALGLRCAAVRQEMDHTARMAAYAADVVYVSSQVLAFDYLRDRTAQGERAGPLHRVLDRDRAVGAPAAGLLRGLVYAIVDEADSIFIDEARTPLILSARLPLSEPQRQAQAKLAAQALAMAGTLQAPLHYRLQPDQRQARLTGAGHAALADIAPADLSPHETAQAVELALVALHLLHRDQHYVVAGEQVRIVDESTGRAMPDRSWERGLHQLVEAKESLAPTAPTQAQARLTCQRLYRRYLRLAGMSGTATEVAAEIGLSYRLPVVAMPCHRPPQRRRWPPCCLPNQASKWAAVVDQVRQVALGQGRPVLVGTRTVADSQRLSALLAEAGIAHQVLNALQDADEAVVVAAAGTPGRVTVATDMAGRGTDIVLAPGVAERGGLHVIVTGLAPSCRIDRQLAGRAGRQGDPGSVAELVAADDALFVQHAPRLARCLAPWLGHPHWGRWALALLRGAAQWRAEALHRAARQAGDRDDREQVRLLAFSGTGE